MKRIDKLLAYWSKKEKDIMLHWPGGISTKSDAHWLSGIFNKEFTEELERRGYNISTIKFSIEPSKDNKKFTSQQTNEKTK